MFDNPDLLSFLKTEEEQAYDGTLLQEVEQAIKAYNREPYGDEEDGRSQVVASDVSETIDYMLTSVLEPVIASGRIVEFEPTSEEDEDVADDATEAMHHIYRRKRGYQVIHDWAKAGLMEKIAIVKSCVERKLERQEQMIPAMMLPGETEEELKAAGIIEAEDAGEVDGVQMVKIVALVEGPASFPDYFVPLEEFRVARDARDLDSAAYLAHYSEKSLSDLVQMGFDVDEVSGLQFDRSFDSSIGQARDDGREFGRDDRAGALRKVWLLEEYPLYDLNGDGIAERLCVSRVGNTILEVKDVDYQPFEYWCPYPMQGRLIGQSLADKVKDDQRINTALERNALDSLYMAVAPGVWLHEESIGKSTISDILTIRPRSIKRWKGSVPPIPEQVQDTSQVAFAAIEFKNRQRESRTGITQLNKGIDKDALNDTARGQDKLMTRGQQMENYVLRNFAEGVGRLFDRKTKMMREHGQPFGIKVDGEYRQVDPSQWPEDLELQVKVGLGSGSKDERVAARNLVAQAHAELKGAGSPLVSDDNIYNNLTGFCKDVGLQPNDLFTNPKDAPPQEPQPDPEMMKVQAEMQMQQAKMQGDQQLGAAKLEFQQQEASLKIQLAREEAAAELELAQAKAVAEMQLAREKMAFEQEQARANMSFEHRLATHQQASADHNSERDAKRRDKEVDGKISKNRPGGKLDA